MELLLFSYVAGALSAFAPCMVPLLPVLLGAAAKGRAAVRALVITLTIGVVVIVSTLVIKGPIAQASLDTGWITVLSGGLLMAYGAAVLFPTLLARLAHRAGVSNRLHMLVGKGHIASTLWGDVLIGLALGPLFTTCSPTYFVVLAFVLPASTLYAVLYISAFVLGLASVVWAFFLLGERLVSVTTSVQLRAASLRRIVGVSMLILGALIAFGVMGHAERALKQAGFDASTVLERSLQARFLPEYTEWFSAPLCATCSLHEQLPPQN